MARLLILADDLTGALDSGVQLAQKGKQVKIVIGCSLQQNQDYESDILVIDTETRHLNPEEAYDCIFKILSDEKLKTTEQIYKKTDSALRGNVGAELSAAMDALKMDTLNFVPAYPKQGRTTVNGIHYVHGEKLSESVFSNDLREPTHESEVKKIVEKQTTKKVVNVNSYDSNEKGIIIYNCSSDEDLKSIYESLNENDGLKLVAGCAGFMEMYGNDIECRDSCECRKKFSDNLTVICGTTNPISQLQLDEAEKAGAYYLKMDMEAIMKDPDWRVKLNELANLLEQKQNDYSIRIIGPLPGKRKYCNMETVISSGFGYMVEVMLRKKECENLMVIGGDTLLGVMNQLKVKCLAPLYEIQSGVVVSRFEYDEEIHYLISKSGGFGKPDLLMNIKERLKYGF